MLLTFSPPLQDLSLSSSTPPPAVSSVMLASLTILYSTTTGLHHRPQLRISTPGRPSPNTASAFSNSRTRPLCRPCHDCFSLADSASTDGLISILLPIPNDINSIGWPPVKKKLYWLARRPRPTPSSTRHQPRPATPSPPVCPLTDLRLSPSQASFSIDRQLLVIVVLQSQGPRFL